MTLLQPLSDLELSPFHAISSSIASKFKPSDSHLETTPNVTHDFTTHSLACLSAAAPLPLKDSDARLCLQTAVDRAKAPSDKGSDSDSSRRRSTRAAKSYRASKNAHRSSVESATTWSLVPPPSWFELPPAKSFCCLCPSPVDPCPDPSPVLSRAVSNASLFLPLLRKHPRTPARAAVTARCPAPAAQLCSPEGLNAPQRHPPLLSPSRPPPLDIVVVLFLSSFSALYVSL